MFFERHKETRGGHQTDAYLLCGGKQRHGLTNFDVVSTTLVVSERSAASIRLGACQTVQETERRLAEAGRSRSVSFCQPQRVGHLVEQTYKTLCDDPPNLPLPRSRSLLQMRAVESIRSAVGERTSGRSHSNCRIVPDASCAEGSRAVLSFDCCVEATRQPCSASAAEVELLVSHRKSSASNLTTKLCLKALGEGA